MCQCSRCRDAQAGAARGSLGLTWPVKAVHLLLLNGTQPALVWRWPGHSCRHCCANPVTLFLNRINVLKWHFSSLHILSHVSSWPFYAPPWKNHPVPPMIKPSGPDLLTFPLACLGSSIIWIEIPEQTKAFHFKLTFENCFRILNTCRSNKSFILIKYIGFYRRYPDQHTVLNCKKSPHYFLNILTLFLPLRMNANTS